MRTRAARSGALAADASKSGHAARAALGGSLHSPLSPDCNDWTNAFSGEPHPFYTWPSHHAGISIPSPKPISDCSSSLSSESGIRRYAIGPMHPPSGIPCVTVTCELPLSQILTVSCLSILPRSVSAPSLIPGPVAASSSMSALHVLGNAFTGLQRGSILRAFCLSPRRPFREVI